MLGMQVCTKGSNMENTFVKCCSVFSQSSFIEFSIAWIYFDLILSEPAFSQLLEGSCRHRLS